MSITSRLIKIDTIHHSITYSIPHIDKIHQIDGHMRKAKPNAAHIIHMFLVFVDLLDMSEIYACATDSHDPPSHEMKRAIRNMMNKIQISVLINHFDNEIYSIIYPIRLSPVVMESRFFLPYLSDSLQKINHHKNIPIEYIH